MSSPSAGQHPRQDDSVMTGAALSMSESSPNHPDENPCMLISDLSVGLIQKFRNCCMSLSANEIRMSCDGVKIEKKDIYCLKDLCTLLISPE